MLNPKKVVYLFILFVICTSTLIYFTMNNIVVVVYLLAIIISGILFAYLSTGKGFVLLISQVLIIGFGLTSYSLYQTLTTQQQYLLVIEHTLLSTCIALLWLILSGIRNMEKSYKEMGNLVKELQKVESQLLILTISEFMSRTKFILTGMKRRRETVYLLKVSLTPSNEHALESVYHIMSKVLLNSIRTEYDLVGRLSNQSIIVLLQNTSETGVKVVVDRFEELLSKEIDLTDVKPYSIQLQELNDETVGNIEEEEMIYV